MDRRERAGVLAGIASSAVGGLATAVTRFAVGSMDPILVTFLRFGIACLLLLRSHSPSECAGRVARI